jgi:hypothetical protein
MLCKVSLVDGISPPSSDVRVFGIAGCWLCVWLCVEGEVWRNWGDKKEHMRKHPTYNARRTDMQTRETHVANKMHSTIDRKTGRMDTKIKRQEVLGQVYGTTAHAVNFAHAPPHHNN